MVASSRELEPSVGEGTDESTRTSWEGGGNGGAG